MRDRSNPTVVSADIGYRSYEATGVAVLSGSSGGIHAEFVDVPLEGAPEPAALAAFLASLAETRGARLLFIDGPQGWRDPNRDPGHSRACEAELNTPAKTGSAGKVKPANYAPFVEFSIALFDHLDSIGWKRLEHEREVVHPFENRAVESFPLAAWKSLGIAPLPAKARSKPEELTSRLKALRMIVPIHLEQEPNHDQLQALVTGLAGFSEVRELNLAPAVHGMEPHMHERIPVEGFIVNPRLAGPGDRLMTIRQQLWYGWQMLPGYGAGDYYSPIHVQHFKALRSGKGLVEIGFFNAGYASGVQGFLIEARVLHRGESYMILDLNTDFPGGRAAIISEITHAWLQKFTPQFLHSDFEAERDPQQLLHKIFSSGRHW
jgi:hypothetical protein